MSMARGDQTMINARRLSFTLATPRTEPVRDILVWDTSALIEFPEAGLNFIELPAFRLNEGGDRLSCKKRLRSPSTLGECFEAFLRVAIEANR